jgi:succinate dehydrogenase hydrophobic anchor subunit
VATLDVTVAAVQGWRNFHAQQRIAAVALFMFLVLFPAVAIWRERTKQDGFGRLSIIIVRYVCLILLLELLEHPH